jgi:hypothetical protein
LKVSEGSTSTDITVGYSRVIHYDGNEPRSVCRATAKFFDRQHQLFIHVRSTAVSKLFRKQRDKEVSATNGVPDGVTPTVARSKALSVKPYPYASRLEIRSQPFCGVAILANV